MIQRQTKDLETTLGLHNQVTELRRERDRLQEQLDDLRREPSAMATPLALTSSEVKKTAMEWKILADRLNGDAIRIREERRQLRDQVKQLQATNQRQADDLAWASFTIDVCREQLEKLKPATQPAGPTPQAMATPLGNRLPTHQEMGGHVRLSTVSGPSPMLMATPDGLSVTRNTSAVFGQN